MSILVEVGLLSGRTATVKAYLEEEVRSLCLRAQTSLGVGKGRLVHPTGSILDARSTIAQTELQNGDSLTLHIMRGPEIQACRGICASGAFAAVLGDGCVVSRGPALRGGDNSPVRNQLHDVQQIQGASGAFAAILAAGSVVTWGEPGAGGDSSSVQHQLKTVQQMQASSGAFAAILVRRDMGGFLVWWRQQCSTGSAETRVADSSLSKGFCCHSWRRMRRNVGSWLLWR